MSTNYNKLNKDQLINLLKQRDEQLSEMNRRIEVIEKKLSESELSQHITKIERNGYKLEQYTFFFISIKAISILRLGCWLKNNRCIVL